jgi:predicted  nucleic acid-binding Zn-ribbon protein
MTDEYDSYGLGFDDGYKEGVEVAKDRINKLERKLNKAMGALEKVQAFVRDLEPHADQGHTLVPALREACETLAELKGETDA